MPKLFNTLNAKEIGSRIRQYREQHGLSQKQLADETGIRPSGICRYEKGSEVPGTIVLARLSAYMDCSIDYLCYGRVEQVVGRFDPELRDSFIRLQDFSDECRRAVNESAIAHMSKEIMQKRSLRKDSEEKNRDTGLMPGTPKERRNVS